MTAHEMLDLVLGDRTIFLSNNLTILQPLQKQLD